MKPRRTSALSKIPKALRKPFFEEITRINQSRLLISSIVLFGMELVLFAFERLFYNIGDIILSILVASLIQIPLIIAGYVYRNKVEANWIHLQYLLYVVTIILFGIAIALKIQTQVDLVHMYLMVIIGVASFSYLSVLEVTIAFVGSYLIFAFMLPLSQTDPSAVLVTRINTLVFIVLAWILNRMIYRLKQSQFIVEHQLKEKNRILEELNQKDMMTGLYNHTSSFQKLYEEIAKSKRIGYPLSMVLMDVDDFKRINDEFGHPAGDHVLTRLSEAIVRTLRMTDVVGRYGGEEFILILPDTDLTHARMLCQRLQQTVSNTVYDFVVTVTLSGGVCEYDGRSVDEFIRQADKLLYQAKRLGKNRFES